MAEQDDRWFETRSGRRVMLDAIHIRSFSHGYLEGRSDLIRDQVLGKIRKTAVELLPGTQSVYLDPLPVDAESMPALAFFCDFTCFSAVGPDADCSSLTTIWYADDLSQTIPDFLKPRMKSVPWETHAVDGYW